MMKALRGWQFGREAQREVPSHQSSDSLFHISKGMKGVRGKARQEVQRGAEKERERERDREREREPGMGWAVRTQSLLHLGYIDE